MNKLQHLQYLNLNRPSRYADNITAIQVKPSLDLNFARNKSLMDNVTGNNLVTFTRASSGTYVGEDRLIKTAGVNEPRFDHNPTTGESLGLLVEEQRTNLLLRSEEFDNASWIPFGTTTRSANATTAPNGTQTADSVTLPVAAGIYQFISGLPSVTYTFSIWIRADSSQSVRLVINTNLSDPVVSTINVSTIWQRYSITKATSAGTTSITAQLDTGGGNTFYLWGAQLEAGDFPTSYIPTTTSAVTRAADVASIDGSNFSSWYRQDEGTVFVQTQGATVASALYSIDDTTTSQRIIGQYASAIDLQYRVVNSGTDQFNATHAAISSGQQVSHVLGYKANDFAGTTNGLNSLTDTSGTVPAVTRIVIGSNVAAVSYINKPIRRLTYFPQRISNANLQRITQ